MNLPDNWNKLPPSHPSDILAWKEDEDEEDGQADSWRCGNPKKRRELVSKFGRSSSVNGSSFMCSTSKKGPSRCLRIIYRIIFGICLLFVIYNISCLLQEKYSRQSVYMNSAIKDINSGLEEDPKYFPIFPRITICRRPFYNTNGYNDSHGTLVSYVMLALGYPFSSFTLTSRIHAENIALHNYSDPDATLSEEEVALKEELEDAEERYRKLANTENFDIKKFVIDHMPNCTEFFYTCTVLFFNLDCCTLFSPVLTSDGLCYTVKDVSRISDIVQRSAVAAEVVLDLVTPPSVVDRTERGFHVYLTDPSESVPMFFDPLDGQKLVNGQVTTIKAELVKVKSTELYTPWHSLWDTCPAWFNDDVNAFDRYSYTICTMQLYLEELKKKCGCKMLYSTEESPGLKYCEPTDMYQCSIRMEDSDLMDEILESCPEACISYSYKTETTYVGLGGESTSRVIIKYNMEYFTFNEYRTATLSSFFSQLGGSLGLYLGASIITLMEMLTFIISWLWYRLVPTKVANKSVNHRPPSSKSHHY